MSIFSYTGRNNPGRNAFNISNSDKFDCKIGKVYPVYFEEVYPGDIIQYGAQMLANFMAMPSPAFIGLNMKIEMFYMPSRNLMGPNMNKYFKDVEPKEDFSQEGEYVEFLNGGPEGLPPDDENAVTLPLWTSPDTSKFSLWDYFGLPVGVDPGNIIDFPRRMYNAIYNEYYRNEFVNDPRSATDETIFYRNWKRDYFTSCLPSQQHGTAPAFPIDISGTGGSGMIGLGQLQVQNTTGFASGMNYLGFSGNGTSKQGVINAVPYAGLETGSGMGTFTTMYGVLGKSTSNLGEVDDSQVIANLLTVNAFDVADVRLSFQIQRWMENTERGGLRYTELLRSHYGIAPSDEVLDRPVYIGSLQQPIVVREINQTSATVEGSPQANPAGKASGAGSGFLGSYKVREPGYVMALFSIVPQRAEYFQGVPRIFTRKTRYDFYWPEFAYLSEQAVLQEEIFASTDEKQNQTVFGYQGRYNELRSGRDKVCGSFRDNLLNWSFARKFENAPLLNDSFLRISEDDDLERIFANTETENIMVNLYNAVKAIRPMPYAPVPGLIDHVY